MKKFFCSMLFLLMIGGPLTACGSQTEDITKVVLTTGFSKNEVFRIEDITCTLPEIMVYLVNTRNQYENVYGTEIWNADLEGITLEQNVKDTVLAKMSQIKTMNLLAREHSIVLDETEEAQVKEAAQEYYGALTEAEIDYMGIDLETVEELYREYALAEKVYAYIIKDINPEISDDEARIITVEHILIKTYTLDGNGERVAYTDAEKQTAYQKAKEAFNRTRDGETPFESLMTEYSEAEEGTYSFGKGEMDEVFETAAFNLAKDEISDIVETDSGYEIIKCLSTFDRNQTDANKVKIVEERRQETFSEEYDAFVKTLTRELNEKLWDGVEISLEESAGSADFFAVYAKYFQTGV
ncbi:MAG: peptidylprolyl isomerase [Lachnospiraceae bacterium]|nr:peptidylprolyl isomerase [Lachnospiraceae bacterium]